MNNTLYNLINQVAGVLMPKSHALYNYILNTSDNNGGFLRTCYCWKSKPLSDRELHDKYKRVLVACESKIEDGALILDNKRETLLKLQFHYDFTAATFEDADWDVSMGYNYVYIVDIENGTYTMKHIECDLY